MLEAVEQDTKTVTIVSHMFKGQDEIHGMLNRHERYRHNLPGSCRNANYKIH